jgi:hypothetical protein
MLFGIFLAVAYVYFFPAALAYILGHKEAGGILFANIAIAWSVLGWFMVLAWALDVKR